MTVLSPTETDNQLHGADPQVRCYSSHFEDSMKMLAPQAVVARYLDDHQSWFERCASPMQVEAIDRQSYSLTLGRFGNFGFEVEGDFLPEGPVRVGITSGASTPDRAVEEVIEKLMQLSEN